MVVPQVTAIALEHVIEIAKDTIQPLGYVCEWQPRANLKCRIVLGSWNAYKKHLASHNNGSRGQAWYECKLQRCNQRNHRSRLELAEHMISAHLSRMPLICPISDCPQQRLLKALDLPQHLHEVHPDVCTKTPPPNTKFLPTLRPFIPHPEHPPSFPQRPVVGLIPIKNGPPKHLSRIYPSTPSKRIPRNPRQVPSSSQRKEEEDDDEDLDLEMDDLEPFEILEDTARPMIIVGKRDFNSEKRLAGPLPMLDPRLYPLSDPRPSIYFPVFSRHIKSLQEAQRQALKGKEKEKNELTGRS